MTDRETETEEEREIASHIERVRRAAATPLPNLYSEPRNTGRWAEWREWRAAHQPEFNLAALVDWDRKERLWKRVEKVTITTGPGFAKTITKEAADA